jgi:hypothetical protein
MFYIHILTDTRRIENTGSKEYKILRPLDEETCQAEGLKVEERAYTQDCGQINISVKCLEIWDQENANQENANQENANQERYLIVPEFFIPGRPYPIYIYIFAIVTYCLNPWMGQREAAKRTRERFDLKTFSHTTLGRALKKLVKQITKNENEPQSKTEPEEAGDVRSGRFPTVGDTKNRRAKAAAYLKKAAATGEGSLTEEAKQERKQPDYRRPPYKGAFIDACHSIVEYTFLKYHCLLL